ncbi:MAG: translation elongation factor Ts [Pseudomonadota bacterium]|nr:translation elongation factor Ts [Pseudomonadota bacterium]
MATISAQMVKELREKTGAGMMDCKSALGETGGDMEAAVDWLRAKGLAKAAKKAGRVAAEGLVGVAVSGNKGAVVEVNSETDFVARNEQFQGMVSEIAELALDAGGDVTKLSRAKLKSKKASVDEHLKEMVATIGENMTLRRTSEVKVKDGIVASYIHNAAALNLGKIGVLVGLESKGDKTKLAELGRQIAMHVAATSPLAVRAEELDPATVDRERAIFAEQARESGKPENIIEKMVEGRVRKFYEEAVLLNQTFVIDGENTVEKAVKAAEKNIGGPVKVTSFVRFALGEGIEKEEQDFAAEVRATSGT